MLNRRQILTRAALVTAGSFVPRLALARPGTERRFVFIIQRGAADGLATLAPMGDPAYAGLRRELAAEYAGLPLLGGMFALHPALKEVGGLYAAGQALFVHAVASPYRDRSHFDGQNVLECGAARPYQLADGWLNRLLPLLPAAEARALAVSATVPAALRGSAPVTSYAPSGLPDANEDLLQRVSRMYATDPALHPLWGEALQARSMAGDLAKAKPGGAAEAGRLVAQMMQGPAGARVVMIESNGWDTHSAQKARLNAQLGGLDAAIGALRDGLGEAWSQTLVVVATEFGRTAAANGTGGTDHGTGSLAMLLGGAVRGGRILADWPGLTPAQLYENRDLRPTRAVDAVIAGALAEHYALDPARLAARLFPGGVGKAEGGLIRA